MPRKTYADYNRPGEADSFEHEHFSGVFGAYLKKSDEESLEALLSDGSGSVLDVGAGSGRLSIHLAKKREGYLVSSDASIEMLQTAASRSPVLDRPVFVLADAQQLPFADHSFDYVISFRTLMHLPDWRKAVAEMCRVARQAVVIDAPARIAAPGVEALYHSVLRAFGGNSSPYTTFFRKDIATAFEDNGYVVDRSDRKFVLPVKVSRLLGNGRLPVTFESFFRKSGISRVLGGQYVLRARRR